MESITLSTKTTELIKHYFALELGNKKVRCPYFINSRKRKAELRSMIGKGTPDEIVLEVLVYAKIRKINLNSINEKEIRDFMIKEGIGVDCSGFVAHIVDNELHQRGINLKSILKFSNNSLYSKILRIIRFIENLGAKDLTSDGNTVEINVKDVQPLDLIRSYGLEDGYHVGVVTEVLREMGTIKSFKYVHSSKFYEEENGVREGIVYITNEDGKLEDQNWIDETNGRNYFKEEYVGKDLNYSGIRRLKVLK